MSFDEKLIEAVRGNSILYDLKHKNYRRIDIKEKIWLDIAHKLKSTEKHCKTRWKSLRDGYRRARRLIPSGSSAPDPEEEILTKKWKYFDLMSFLYSVEDQRNTTGNFETYVFDFNSDTDGVLYDEINFETSSEIDTGSSMGLEDIPSSTPAKKTRASSTVTSDILYIQILKIFWMLQLKV